jgi:chromosomal replication initiation ATPase DnaA
VRTSTIVEGAVAQVFGVGHGDLFRATRGRARIALARQVAMYLAHVCCGLTFTEIGHLFGRDRTTVAHACAVVEDRRDDPIFDRTLELLEWVVPSLLFPERVRCPWSGETR